MNPVFLNAYEGTLLCSILVDTYTDKFLDYIFTRFVPFSSMQPKTSPHYGEYNVYSTFQSHEPDFDYLKSLDIDEKINQIKWLKKCNSAHFLLSTNGELY